MIWATPMLAGLVAACGMIAGCVSVNFSRVHAGLDEDEIRGVVRSVLRYEMEFDAANAEMEGLGLHRQLEGIYSVEHYLYPVYGNGVVQKTGLKGVAHWPEEIELRFDDIGRLVEVIHRDGYLPDWRSDDETVVSMIPLTEGIK